MINRRTKIAGAIIVSCLALLGVAALKVVGPEPHFVCHRALDGALQQWMLETTNTVWLPNVKGSSSQSLALLLPYLGTGATQLRDYRYVPGLRSDDPEELITIYVRKPSRRTWHGDAHWFRAERRWVVLNPRISQPDTGDPRRWSECGEAVSTTEFKARLRATLAYLKSNARPEWQAVVEEHTGLLNSINK